MIAGYASTARLLRLAGHCLRVGWFSEALVAILYQHGPEALARFCRRARNLNAPPFRRMRLFARAVVRSLPGGNPACSQFSAPGRGGESSRRAAASRVAGPVVVGDETLAWALDCASGADLSSQG